MALTTSVCNLHRFKQGLLFPNFGGLQNIPIGHQLFKSVPAHSGRFVDLRGWNEI
jgi:hypothetical protein